jgi:hypothetical protein
MNGRQTVRWTALILCVSFMTLSFFSEAFLLDHTNHDCCGDGCPVCLQIQWARDFSRQFRYASCPVLTSIDGPLVFCFCVKTVFLNPVPLSSVSLKVKMNR